MFDDYLKVMLNKRLKVFLLSTLILGLTLTVTHPSFATDPIQKKQEIEKLQQQISDVDKQITSIEEEMVSLSGRLEGLKKEINVSQEKLKKVQEEIKQREDILRKRIKQLYLQDRQYGIIILLDSEGFWDFINRIKFLTFISKAEAKNIDELKNLRRKENELLLVLNDSKKKTESYLAVYEQKKLQLKSLKESLQDTLKRAKREYSIMLSPKGIRKYASRGYIVRGGGYRPDELVPKKFVRVSPYDEAFLTSERMPEEYESSGKSWSCYASWYGNEFHGRRTASGEIFNQWDFTVAHRSLPFGTFVLIRRGDRAIVAKVTDRGPFIPGREFDLSRACAEALGFSGVAKIEVEIIFPKR
ncbi:MAG: septal ring lytic transglycosylase RlpA family protein [Actinobacteria bacterium]|nr:septal ring lytic transglycosylase RlpA family protein [Actinomycetota bacterium]